MELCPDNIEELARGLAGNTSSQQDSVFQTNTDFSAIDVDRVISDAQDSLLNTSIEAIRSCDVPSSFNDILDDICKMNNNIEMQQAALNAPIPQLLLESQAYYHMPDLEMQAENYTSECNYPDQTDFLQPLGQWSDYLPIPPSALSNIQDIPQLAPIPKTPSPPPVPVVTKQIKANDTPASNANPNIEGPNLEASTPVPENPIQYFNNYHFTIPPAMVHPHSIMQCNMSTTNVHISQGSEPNINLMVLPDQPVGAPNIHVVQQQPPLFDWARVVPRRAFLKTPEVVVLRPLRTRRVMSARPSFDLATYFDTSTISIPMIRERPRSKTNRRKQKLYTIPGAENLVFEVQLRPPEDKDTNNNDQQQLYPETEIPELDEIFKRKRRTVHSRRIVQHQDSIKTLSPVRPPMEEPYNDEEDSPSPEKKTESFSDVDSDDAPLTIVKSMKCTNCRKLFKSCRSLTIHSKRCKITPKSPVKKEAAEEVKTGCVDKVPIKNVKENIEHKKEVVGRVVTRSLTRSQARNAAKRKIEDDGAAQKRSK